MSTGALGPNLDPGQWKIVDSDRQTVGRMSKDGKTLEIYKVDVVMGHKYNADDLRTLIEKFNADTQKYSKINDTTPFALKIGSTGYTVKYQERQELVNTVAQNVFADYQSRPVPKPPKTTWTENDTAEFMKTYELKNARTGKIVQTDAEVTKIIKMSIESKAAAIRKETQKALRYLGNFSGYTIQSKEQEAPLSTQGTSQQAPQIPPRKPPPPPIDESKK